METRGTVVIVGLNYAPESTGIAPYTAALARGMRARDWNVRVVTTHPHYPGWKLPSNAEWDERRVVDGVDVARKRHYVPRRPRGVLRLVSEISFGFRAVVSSWRDADAVVLVSPSLFSSAMVLLSMRFGRRKPVLTWIQDLYSLGITETGQGGAAVASFMRRIESWTVRKSDAVAVIHDRFRDHVVYELGASPDRTHVVRNWTHLPELPEIDRLVARARFGWAPNDTIVVHAGAMGIKQGLTNVVGAARLAEAEHRAMRFVMIGGGSQREMLEEHSRGLSNFDILDSLPDEEFQMALQAANVLLVNEKPGIAGMAVPSKLTSYFNAGRPVLAATDPGSVTESEVVRSGGGVVVPAGDPAALVNAAVALGEDPERALALGEAGRSFRRAHLSEDVALDTYAQLLADLGQGASSPAGRLSNPTNVGTI